MKNIAARPLVWFFFSVFFLICSTPIQSAESGVGMLLGETIPPGFDPETGKRIIPNQRCLKCHGDENEKTDTRDDGSIVDIYVEPHKIKDSVHGKQDCTNCHVTVTRVPHREAPEVVVGCVECHRQTWDEHKDDPEGKHERLGVVVEQIDSFMTSVHARPNTRDQSSTNATCYDCHDAHNIGSLGSHQRAEHRLENPEVCGACHRKQLSEYRESDHGKAVLEKGDSESAVCSDCHTTHDIDSPEGGSVMLTITENCGSCHEDAQKSYRSSYHGQVNKLGYTHSAKCFDCHGGHKVRSVDDPTSTIHLDNRLETCNKCHEDAPEGFLGFHAHGHGNDFEKYPGIWIVTKFMQLLIIGVLGFFWVHVILWFYREYQDRKAGKSFAHPRPGDDTVYVRRFTATWRWIHLLFAVSTMILVLSGTTLLFSHTAWAGIVMTMLGGPEVEAILHRTAATIWIGVFLLHFILAMSNIMRNRDTFRWFGPSSMVPNMQDLQDVGAMFSWFFGRRERPNFDRFTYWQKFDYWAPFWGAAVIGFSGIMLFAPKLTATFLPGWIFNIATIVHAEEALLATMFLFTVHFFNSHFRPDRFPMSTIMFTGAVPLEEFKFEHRVEYERLKASGELDKCLIKPPSEAMEKGSRALSVVLIFAGLGLLTLVFIGYLTMPS
ncbi:MAG: cytochrome C [Candidatus Thiodiazotropha sp.]|nr:cytochrome C [Candidatus Thiodiazotropha sp.]MCM8884029.1 cytochrome C [Candidatus Thiodiazotropha sp.]MCM8919690.1 cytochrome C [Candidatus Thiodiazotropha sp.]MCU7875024.1 cytochrome C [Candidatus Thiodiazotropha sp. (ex Lucinoma borealis)]